MLNLGSESALCVGVILHPRQEHALSMGVDMVRAILSVSTPMDRAALSVGVNLRSSKSGSIHGCRHG